MPFFSKVFKSKDAAVKKSLPAANGDATKKPQWSDAWVRTRVDPEEVSELLHLCTVEMKSRALDVPFLLLPFRPSSDPSAARTFVRNFFGPSSDRQPLRGAALQNELRMTEVMVIISVMKWCWARLPGGVVTWEAYEGFRVGEKDAGFARDAFTTFIPLGVESSARRHIIKDFFDLLSAVAAHGKTNGLGGFKLSRYAGWWAFEHYDSGKGFESGYKSWASAADATSHLFFAYLRSLSPESGKAGGIMTLPRSLQQLLAATAYPPRSNLLSNDTTKVIMIVDVVSPTPYALLRRAKNFQYRDDDQDLQQFSNFEDPVQALTDECRRVLKAISSTNASQVSNAKTSTSLADPSWSRFEDVGFGSSIEEEDDDDDNILGRRKFNKPIQTMAVGAYEDLARPTTPSWADFLSSGFADENGNKAPSPILLPPDKILPPITTSMPRGHSSQSHRRNLDAQPNLDPGELASITRVDMDDSFWWVWISSLASEEPTSRKAVFGRCALIETVIEDGKWMIMEEQVKGAAPEPVAGAYIAEKKTFLGFTTKRGRLTRRRSGIKKSPLSAEPKFDASNRATLAPDQAARIQQAAAELTRKKAAEEKEEKAASNARRGRVDENGSASKTNSIATLGPHIKDEASPALQWASQYDKKAIRAKYLGDSMAGKGSGDLLGLPSNGLGINRSTSTLSVVSKNKELPAPPADTKVASVPLEPSKQPDKATIPATFAASAVIEPAPLPTEPVVPASSSTPADATEVPLPPATPDVGTTQPVKHQPAKLRKSVDGTRRSPDEKKTKTKAPGPPPVQQKAGIRRLFGTMRSKSREPAPVEEKEDPAVAAARRALEGKPAIPSEGPTSPPLSPGHFQRLATAKAPKAVTQAEPSPQLDPSTEQDVQTTVPETQLDVRQIEYDDVAPPRTRRDEEYDQLSRVDTNEREHADREFSTFDQGPLLDQPAFVPSDTPTRSEFITQEEEIPARVTPQIQLPTTATRTDRSEKEEEREVETPASAQPTSPTDRWAQIRKNAAERAARQQPGEEATTRSRGETKTDDGETSGEETIESRVARIKARVAELTGNMEQTRR